MKKTTTGATDTEVMAMAGGLVVQLSRACAGQALSPEMPWVVLAVAAKMAEDSFNYAGTTPPNDPIEHVALHSQAQRQIAKVLKTIADKSAMVTAETDAEIGLKRERPQ